MFQHHLQIVWILTNLFFQAQSDRTKPVWSLSSAWSGSLPRAAPSALSHIKHSCVLILLSCLKLAPKDWKDLSCRHRHRSVEQGCDFSGTFRLCHGRLRFETVPQKEIWSGWHHFHTTVDLFIKFSLSPVLIIVVSFLYLVKLIFLFSLPLPSSRKLETGKEKNYLSSFSPWKVLTF